MTSNTIFALSSGSGKSGIAVFRLSGPAACSTFKKITGVVSPVNRNAYRIKIRNPKTQETIDDGLGIFFRGPNSSTGEDVVELHVHGSPAVKKEISKLLSEQAGLAHAEPGEFTRRAFENNKLDLTAVEGLGDLINAETSAQRRLAQRQLSGELSSLYGRWKTELTKATALFEAEIDFSDQSLTGDLLDDARRILERVKSEIREHLSNPDRARLVREGFYIAIVGPPNSGKSSILNAISSKDVSIISEKAGTTRDVVEVALDLGGFSVTIGDTAGIRETSDELEKEGITRALKRAESADYRLVILDGEKHLDIPMALENLRTEKNTLFVINKVDLVSKNQLKRVCRKPMLCVSALTGKGLKGLIEKIIKEVTDRCQSTVSQSVIRDRHIQSLQKCLKSLENITPILPVELAAEDIRLAVRALGKITGRVDVEDVLNVIFRDFCIGK